jgi:hypothetical protein
MRPLFSAFQVYILLWRLSFIAAPMSHHSSAQVPCFLSDSHPLLSSSDDDFHEQDVVTLRPEGQATPPRSQAGPPPPPHALHNHQKKHQISFKTAGKISVELTRRSRRARLAILDRVLQERIEDLEVAAVVCAHLHDR